jgi:hypothetical protein
VALRQAKKRTDPNKKPKQAVVFPDDKKVTIKKPQNNMFQMLDNEDADGESDDEASSDEKEEKEEIEEVKEVKPQRGNNLKPYTKRRIKDILKTVGGYDEKQDGDKEPKPKRNRIRKKRRYTSSDTDTTSDDDDANANVKDDDEVEIVAAMTQQVEKDGVMEEQMIWIYDDGTWQPAELQEPKRAGKRLNPLEELELREKEQKINWQVTNPVIRGLTKKEVRPIQTQPNNIIHIVRRTQIEPT